MGLGDVSFCLKGGFLRSVMSYSTMGLRERLLVSNIQIEICLQVP